MSDRTRISRRTILRGLGVAMALPLLDVMSPLGLSAASAATPAATGAAAALAAPRRVAWVFFPNGMNMPYWTPEAFGSTFDLPPSLAPLKNLRDYLAVYTGLAQDNAFAKGDGPGDHARGAAAFLTGAHPFKTAGSNIKLGVSIDQYAAQKIGDQTRFASLELGLDRGNPAGNCDSGYSCAYVSNISWRSDTTPVPAEINPAKVFERLFGAGDKQSAETMARRAADRRSVLDFVAEDAKQLNARLGAGDQRKLDEFQSAIREIEKRIALAQARQAEVKLPQMDKPAGIPRGDPAEHMKLMCDMMVLAFQMDLTRVSTLMVARDGSDRVYRNLGLTEGHHSISHHGRKPEKIESIRKIDLFHMQQMAYFLEKLKATTEGAGNLLDNSLVLLGSGIADGDAHNHDNLPIITIGKGGGAVTPGRHLRFPRRTPLCNLFLTMLDSVGAKAEKFGDSTGRLPGMTA